MSKKYTSDIEEELDDIPIGFSVFYKYERKDEF